MVSVRSSAGYRIAIAYAAVIAWMFLIMGITAHVAVDNELSRQRDERITRELDRLARYPRRTELLRELQWRQSHPLSQQFEFALFDARGERVAGTLEIENPLIGFADLPPPGHSRNGIMRAGSRDLADGSQLVVAVDTEVSQRVGAILFRVLLAAFVATMAITAIGGVILSSYLRGRLKSINAAADASVTTDIEWRVPLSSRGDEFDEAASAVNLMLDRIAGLTVNLRQVSSDIAHDLRKPLMRLLWQTDRIGRVEGAEQRVSELGDEMLALFSGILRIAEVEGGELERNLVPVDLSSLLLEVVESYAPALTDADDTLDWVIEPDVTVMGNRELLAQVVANLLDNARIHTPAGTVIKVGLAADGTNARLSVEDDGPGVAEADRDKLLQRFFRAETSRTTPGNGLGLSLVAAIARAHRGEVAVENADPGLRIVVTIPIVAER